MIRLIAMLVLAAVMVIPTMSFAEEKPFAAELHYDPHERLKMAATSASGFAGATNVELKAIEHDYNLPDFIRAQATLIATQCTGSADNASLIKFYRYTSDLTRQQKLPPNYLADLSGLGKRTQSACIIGHACLRGECTLVGYNATGAHMWNQDFTVMSKSWAPKTVEDPKTKDVITLLEFTSICNKGQGDEQRRAFDPPAKSSDKKEADEKDRDKDKKNQGCVTDHVWLGTGLLGYQPAMMNSYTLPTPEEQEPPADDKNGSADE